MALARLASEPFSFPASTGREGRPLNPLLLVAGLLVVLASIVDALWTALWVDGHAGPFTRSVNQGVQRVVRLLARGNHRALSLTGPIIVTITVLAWALLLWAGWVMVFSAEPRALVGAHDGIPASVVERTYFVGYTIFTMGNGDFTPTSTLLELSTAFAGMSGLMVLTLSVTYVLAIVGAVVKKRSFASEVRALGRNADDFLLHMWDGERFAGMELVVRSLTEQLNAVTEQHSAYPMLHYYHEAEQRQSVPHNLAAFSDVILVLKEGVEPRARPAAGILQLANESIRDYLETIASTYVESARDHPPVPALERSRAAGLPLLPEAVVAQAFREEGDMRRLLLGFVHDERRHWPGTAEERAG